MEDVIILPRVTIPKNKVVFCQCSSTICGWKNRHGSVTHYNHRNEPGVLILGGALRAFRFKCERCNKKTIIYGRTIIDTEHELVEVKWRPQKTKPQKSVRTKEMYRVK